MKNLEKSLWFHAHLAFEVIPGTLCCTLIKCLWCVDHTCRGMCSKHSWRGGATVSFGCPGLAGTKLPLCCVQRFAVMTRLTSAGFEDGYKLFTWFIGGADFSDCILRMQSVVLKASDLSWASWQLRASIFSAPFWLREKAGLARRRRFMSLSQPMLLRESWLSTPPGKFGDVRHIFISLVQYHTGQLIGKSWMFFFLPSLSSLTDKLVNCMCRIGGLSQCVEVEVGGLY